ncbi:MAG: OmpH family outer membrane protein [Nitrospirales bacterium]
MDTKWLLAESKLGKQVTESLNQFMKDRQALIELEQKELRGLESELLRQGSVLNPSAKQQREERFRRRMVEYQGKVANLNLEVQKKQVELFGEFRSSVDTVVAKVAQRHGLVLVLEKGENSPTRYHQPSLNISKEVLEEMDREVQ